MRRAVPWIGTALFCLALALAGLRLIPGKGYWGIDAGLKSYAALQVHEEGLNHYHYPDLDRGLDPEGRFSSWHPHFVVTTADDRRISVFSPTWLALLSALWDFLGENGGRYVSLIATCFICLALPGLIFRIGSDKNVTEANDTSLRWLAGIFTVLASPLLFYSMLIWEHAFFLALALSGLLLLRVQARLTDAVAGFLIALGASIRPEGLLLAITVFAYPVLKFRWACLAGFFAGAAGFIGLNLYATGVWLPVQWTINAGLGDWTAAGLFQRIAVLMGPGIRMPEVILMLLLLALAIIAARGQTSFRTASLVTLSVLHVLLVGYGWIAGVSLGRLAMAGGWLISAPLSFYWLALESSSPEEKRLKQILAGFSLLVLLSNPVPWGVHWGPRFLLPALVIGTAGAVVHLKKTQGWQQWAMIVLLCTSIAANMYSLKAQALVRLENAVKREAVQALPTDKLLLIEDLYSAGDLGPTLQGRWVLVLRGRQSQGQLYRILQQAELDEIYSLGLSHPFPESFVDPGFEPVVGNGWSLYRFRLIMDSNDRRASLAGR